MTRFRIIERLSDDCSLATSLAIAFAGRMAADLGADVGIVDSASVAQRRVAAPLVEGRSSLSRFLDRGKTMMASSDGLDSADVVLTDRLLPDAAMIQVVVTDRPANAAPVQDSEFTLLAIGGLLDLVGDPASEPLRLGGHQLAYSAGLAAYAGLAAALCKRQAGCGIETVRVALSDVAVWLNWKSVAMGSWSKRVAARLGDNAEWRTIRCADGWVALVYLEADWPVLRALVDDPRLTDPVFEDRNERRRNAAMINGIVEQAFAQKTRAELRDTALARRLPLGAVWSPAELESDPQYVARNFLVRAPDADGVKVLAPAVPAIWNGRRPGTVAAGALL